MRATQILRPIALLTFSALSGATAEETDAGAQRQTGAVEEIVVKSASRCGSWPIRHQRLRGCEFAELKKEDLQKVLGLRTKLLSTCLICQGNRCVTKVWPKDRTTEKRLCKIVFWTPTRVSRSTIAGGSTGPLRVSFTFKISTDGRVEDIELVSFESDIGEEELLQLIEDGATRTRFEPVVVADVAYEIVGLRDAFVLNDFWIR